MSWKRISRPQALPQGLDTHRTDAAQKLVDWYTGGAQRGDLGDRIDYLTGRRERAAADLVRDLGGVAKAARATGASERTVRDWAAGRHAPSSRFADTLAKEARRATVRALGGTRGVAALTGRSESTIRSWVRKPVQAKGDAVHQLNKHEVRQRHLQARQLLGQSGKQPLVMQTSGHIRVKATTSTPEYEVDRVVNHEVQPETQSQIEDLLARGVDPSQVHQLIESDLTGDRYAGLGDDLYDGRDFGFFVDRIDEINMGDSLPGR
ncbi:hypothetical protein [Amycolatopsis sp. NPDC058986]|uniref:hypothetical protein n=1 Tax=unclassified Amycolatopsis TaxID=2618356 RepID=UPI003670397B